MRITTKEIRSTMSADLKAYASKLKEKKIKISSASMLDIAGASKLYSLMSEVLNTEKLEELIDLQSYSVALEEFKVLAEDIKERVLPSNSSFNLEDLLNILDRGDDYEAEDSAASRIGEIMTKRGKALDNAELLKDVSTVLSTIASVVNTVAHSKESVEDMSNWAVRKAANLMNKVAEILDKEEAPQPSTEDLKARMRMELRKSMSTGKDHLKEVKSEYTPW